MDLLLGESFIERCICCLFLIEEKVVRSNSHQVAISHFFRGRFHFSSRRMSKRTRTPKDRQKLKTFPSRETRPKTVPSKMPSSISAACPAAGLSLIEFHGDVVIRQQSMNAWWTMKIFLVRPFEVFVADLLVPLIVDVADINSRRPNGLIQLQVSSILQGIQSV